MKAIESSGHPSHFPAPKAQDGRVTHQAAYDRHRHSWRPIGAQVLHVKRVVSAPDPQPLTNCGPKFAAYCAEKTTREVRTVFVCQVPGCSELKVKISHISFSGPCRTTPTNKKAERFDLREGYMTGRQIVYASHLAEGRARYCIGCKRRVAIHEHGKPCPQCGEDV